MIPGVVRDAVVVSVIFDTKYKSERIEPEKVNVGAGRVVLSAAESNI
ncbi:MAG: hypothetical protein WA667_00985 [Candidatus Nitrosopolaris sp.]